jgi:D-alanyl-D-alanine carboxypeptidase
MKIPVLALGAMLATGPVRAERGNPDMTISGESVDEMIATFMREEGISGLALAIVQAPYIPRVTGYGLADQASRRLVGSHTLFDLGPLVDAYLSVAVMQLVEGGKLDLDKPAVSFLSGAPDTPVRNLVFGPDGKPSPETRAVVEKLITAVSGESVESFLRRNQFERLGLRQTVFGSDLAALPWEKSGPHSEFLRQPTLINPTEPASGDGTRREPAAGLRIYASAFDVSVWDIGLAGEILVRDPALRKMLYHPPAGRVRQGAWYFPGHPGLMVTTGSRDGFSALLSRFTDPADLLCVTLLASKGGVDLTQLARRIAGAYDRRLGPPPEAEGLRVQQSPFPPKETLDRLEAFLRSREVMVVARIDHQKAAAGAGLTLGPVEELLFGKPSDGTLFMQQNPAVATDLPLRAAVWEKDGAVWITATDPVEIARRHGLTGLDELALKMRRGVDAALRTAVDAP